MPNKSPRTGPRRVDGGLQVPGADDGESPSAPSIPSFASLRDARRRSPADLLVSGPPADVEQVPMPPSGTPRPPEWADLWHLGLRVARWCVRQPITTVRRLLG